MADQQTQDQQRQQSEQYGGPERRQQSSFDEAFIQQVVGSSMATTPVIDAAWEAQLDTLEQTIRSVRKLAEATRRQSLMVDVSRQTLARAKQDPTLIQ